MRSALFLLLITALLAPRAKSAAGCSEPSPECVEVGHLNISMSLGGGVRTNPIRNNSDIPLLAVPQISYYGRRFFLENLELGVTLHETDSNAFNLVATPGYDRVFFFRNDLQNIFIVSPDTTAGGAIPSPTEFPVPPRRTTYLAGPEWSFSQGRFVGQLGAFYELTGRHKGTEVRAALAAPVFERKGELVVSGGFTWKSAELVRYYYAVDGLYAPGAALNPFVKVAYDLPLSDRWAFSAFAHYEHLDHAVAASPLVSEPRVTTMFVGLVCKIL